MRQIIEQPILTAVAANGVGQPVKVREMSTVSLMISTTGNGQMTLTVLGSAKGDGPVDGTPDFVTANLSAENHFTPIATVDLNNLDVVSGTAGIALGGVDANNFKTLMLNVGGLDSVNVEVSGYSAGAVTVIAKAYSENGN